MDQLMVYTPEMWMELITTTITAITAAIVTVIAALNAGKIADASSSTASKVIDLIKTFLNRKKR